MANTERVSVRVPAHLMTAARDASGRHDAPPSEVVRVALAHLAGQPAAAAHLPKGRKRP